MTVAAVTLHLPPELLRAMDAQPIDRDALVEQAVRRELARREREELRASLGEPHPESLEMAEMGLADYAQSLPDDDAALMCDLSAGTPVRWSEGRGWTEEPA